MRDPQQFREASEALEESIDQVEFIARQSELIASRPFGSFHGRERVAGNDVRWAIRTGAANKLADLHKALTAARGIVDSLEDELAGASEGRIVAADVVESPSFRGAWPSAHAAAVGIGLETLKLLPIDGIRMVVKLPALDLLKSRIRDERLTVLASMESVPPQLPPGTSVTEAEIPAEYREGGSPNGHPLTVKYLESGDGWFLSGSYITRNYGAGKPLTTHLKCGRRRVFRFDELSKLRQLKTREELSRERS